MRVLGIFDDHNCGCAIVEDGMIKAAIEEERLSRIKFHNGTTDDGLPCRSLKMVLEMTKSDPSNIDMVSVAVASPWLLLKTVLRDLLKVQRVDRWTYHSLFSKSIRWDRYFLLYPYYYNQMRIRKVKGMLRQFGLSDIPLELVDHHAAHAASAYYTFGKSDAMVVTMDGQGDGLCGSVYRGEGGVLSKMTEVSSFHSIGLFYNFITWMLGFKPNRHEGKITGLAAYGDPKVIHETYQNLFHMDGPEFRYDLAKKVFHHAYPHRSNYPKFLDATNGVFDAFSREDISAGVQELTESCMTQFISHHLESYLGSARQSTDVCLAGGVFANVKVNQRVAELPGVDSVYIFPAMGDGGLCAGSALWTYYAHCPEERSAIVSRKIRDVYLGPSYSDDAIEACLKASGLVYTFVQNIEDRIGELLAQGHVVARFSGRMEFGPRALGNRSILYQPTDPTVNDWLNKKLKRTEFMPFAPSTLGDHPEKMYRQVTPNLFPARFMTITFNCTDELSRNCPATVHVDNTARPQLVDREINDSYYHIIKSYQKRTGLSTIINTSFNMHEEPIVCSPDDAIRAFKLGHLDYLAIGSFLVASENPSERS